MTDRLFSGIFAQGNSSETAPLVTSAVHHEESACRNKIQWTIEGAYTVPQTIHFAERIDYFRQPAQSTVVQPTLRWTVTPSLADLSQAEAFSGRRELTDFARRRLCMPVCP